MSILTGILAIIFYTCLFSFVFGVGPVSLLVISEGNLFPAIPILLIWVILIVVVFSYKLNEEKTIMQIKQKKPWLAYILALKFPLILDKDTLMVWGNTIYYEGEEKVTGHLLKHEKVHIKQCRGSKWIGLLWWLRYSFSKKFRLSQELEAYRVQYKHSGDPRVLIHIANDLSGKLYGNLISYEEAIKLIKE